MIEPLLCGIVLGLVPITLLGLSLFDQKLNRDWQKMGAANSPLGLIHDVNFNIEKYEYLLDETADPGVS